MNVLRRKDASVVLDPIAPAGGAILAAAAMAATTIKCDLVITCGSEGHPPTDPHTLGEAIDIRTSDLSEGQLLALYHALKTTLGPKFTVLYEVKAKPAGVLGSIAYVNTHASAPHLHIQRAKNTRYPESV